MPAVTPTPSGLPTVDHQWGGLAAGRAYLLVGRAGAGRSALALQTARATVEAGRRCLVVSPRDPQELVEVGRTVGLDLAGAHNAGQLRLLRIPQAADLAARGPEGLAKAYRDFAALVASDRPARVVVEDFTPLVQFDTFERFHDAFGGLVDALRAQEASLVVGLGDPANDASRRLLEVVEGLVDGTIRLGAGGDLVLSLPERPAYPSNDGASVEAAPPASPPAAPSAPAPAPTAPPLSPIALPPSPIAPPFAPDPTPAPPAAFAPPAPAAPAPTFAPPAPAAPAPPPSFAPSAPDPTPPTAFAPPAPETFASSAPEAPLPTPAFAPPSPVAPSFAPDPTPAPDPAPPAGFAPPMSETFAPSAPETPPDSFAAPAPPPSFAPDPTPAFVAPEPLPMATPPAAASGGSPPATEVVAPPAPDSSLLAPPADPFGQDPADLLFAQGYLADSKSGDGGFGAAPPAPTVSPDEPLSFGPPAFASLGGSVAAAPDPGVAFREALDRSFASRHKGTPFVVVALRMDPSAPEAARFSAVEAGLRSALRAPDRLLVDSHRKRAAVVLPASGQDAAQGLFAGLQTHLRNTLGNEGEQVLAAIGAVTVPDGQPFQSSAELVAYAFEG